MKVREEIEKFSDPEERADLLLVFGMYHMNSEWNILSTCEFIGTFPNAKRKWRLSSIGKAVASQHRGAEHVRILDKLNEAEVFETFLQTKFVGQKRFSLEGGESLFVGNAKGYVRLNLAMPRAIIQTGLERMRDAIRNERADH